MKIFRCAPAGRRQPDPRPHASPRGGRSAPARAGSTPAQTLTALAASTPRAPPMTPSAVQPIDSRGTGELGRAQLRPRSRRRDPPRDEDAREIRRATGKRLDSLLRGDLRRAQQDRCPRQTVTEASHHTSDVQSPAPRSNLSTHQMGCSVLT